MPDHAVVILNIDAEDTASRSRPFFERYCARYQLDLVELKEEKYGLRGQDPQYSYRNFEKFQAFDCLNHYQRILRVDLDVLISPSAPNVFEWVPVDHIGAVYEDYGRRRADRYRAMEDVARTFDGAPWGQRRYFNSGIMVFSRMHQQAFQLNEQDVKGIESGALGRQKEQNLCNWKARENGCAIRELDYRFNHLRLFSEWKRGAPHRLDSFFIHYAGSQSRKNQRMARDAQRLHEAWETGSPPRAWWQFKGIPRTFTRTSYSERNTP